MIHTPSARVLIVCTANAIRSPFVEHLLRSRLPRDRVAGLLIESAGSAARPGRPAESQVVEMGRMHGIDLEGHRTRRLEESMLGPGLTVLCAAAVHRRTVLDMRPDLLDTTFTVREFARLLIEVPGPIDGPGDWAALVRIASRRRTQARRGQIGDDDLIDPIAQPPSVWADFERDAVDAVTAIAHGVERLLRPGADPLPEDGPPRTRRALRARMQSGAYPV